MTTTLNQELVPVTTTLNQELVPATEHRILRSLALRTRTAGGDSFQPGPLRSTTATRPAMPTSLGPTPRTFCSRASASSIWPPTRASKRRWSSGDPGRLRKDRAGRAAHAERAAGRACLLPRRAWTPANSRSNRRRRWLARRTRRSSSSCTGRRCCGTSPFLRLHLGEPVVAVQAAAELSTIADLCWAARRRQRSPRTCCSAAVSPARRWDPTCPSSCCSHRDRRVADHSAVHHQRSPASTS